MAVSVPGNSCRSCGSLPPATNGCVLRLPGECVYYSGASIPSADINMGDSFNTVVNKLASSAPVYTANNGLTMTSNNTQLGGALVKDTTITSPNINFRITYSGISTFAEGAQFDVITTGNIGFAIRGSTTNGRGVFGVATDGVGVYGTATSPGGYGLFSSTPEGNAVFLTSNNGMAIEAVINPADATSVLPMASFTRASQILGANGIGQSLDFYITTTTSSQLSGQIVNKWTTATNASRTSQFEIWGVNNATTQQQVTIKGTGQTQLNRYGSGTFSGSAAYTLQVDSSGNIIEGSATGGGGIIPFTSTNFDVDGVTVTDASLNGKTYEIFLNDLNRFIYNEVGNQEWDYVVGGGFTILIPGFDATTNSYHLYLFLK